jgi:hypothetical protein
MSLIFSFAGPFETRGFGVTVSATRAGARERSFDEFIAMYRLFYFAFEMDRYPLCVDRDDINPDPDCTIIPDFPHTPFLLIGKEFKAA